jgi:hypothetical protein
VAEGRVRGVRDNENDLDAYVCVVVVIDVPDVVVVDVSVVVVVSVELVPVMAVSVIGAEVELELVVADVSVTAVLLVSLVVVLSVDSFLQPKAKRTRAVTQRTASVFFICSSLFHQTSVLSGGEHTRPLKEQQGCQ